MPDLLVDLPADERRGGEQFALQLDAVMASRSADRGAVRAADAAPPEADADPAADAPGALALQAVRAAGSALTAGTVWWALRAGGLMASLLVVLPAWRHVDLLAVLPDDEDDPWEHLGEDGTEGRPDPADDEAARDEQAVRRVFEPTSAGEHR